MAVLQGNSPHVSLTFIFKKLKCILLGSVASLFEGSSTSKDLSRLSKSQQRRMA